jgi:xanthine/uracil/vitamin C permease (AzgA family)
MTSPQTQQANIRTEAIAGITTFFISHVGLYLIVGRRRDIHPVMYALAAVSIGLLLLEHAKFS